ncbi:MAG: (2Fe-2S) ferredoxin domain-containing protein [Labilithrix sp.]|nr:(2Fe-2S) ferredoxin domain-containing protein [Labilithrix sp.]MCW5809660.1 (2Fe-2S) ferredoxin domain-containing protein [Labilithrix sp.]
MREAIAPRLHFFVCANRREGSPLGPGCGPNGDAVYDALKSAVTRVPGGVASIWVTKTHCLGICPKHGCTVARYPNAGPSIMTEVTPADVPALLESKDEVAHELALLEELQRKKVLDLARRLKPGLTLEDVQNPHDFPELDDPDWHYADGVLAGIASVKMALAARGKQSRRNDGEEE